MMSLISVFCPVKQRREAVFVYPNHAFKVNLNVQLHSGPKGLVIPTSNQAEGIQT